MKYSNAFIKTMKQDIADAEVISHKLMHRSSMIRKLAAGIYEWLPLGYRVLRKVENIIREEMNKAGSQEVFLPALQPKELWDRSSRWELYGKELVRIKDRNDREFCLGPTHEEVITDLVANVVDSYRQLPVTLYQFQTKFRDEIRPRFGIMRAREFLMKDAYSFDIDDKAVEKTYKKMREVYENIFKRCGLDFRVVEAESGNIGGSLSHEFMVTADTGESDVASCTCGYAANTEKATCKILTQVTKGAHLKDLDIIKTPSKKTIDEVSEFLDIDAKRFIKTLVYVADKEYIIVLVRGDRQINEAKLGGILAVSELRMATDEEVLAEFGVEVGFLGPIGLKKDVKIIADNSVLGIVNGVTGANKKDYHLINVDFCRHVKSTDVVDLMLVKEGDKCAVCGNEVSLSRGIEVGHIFKLGTKYSEKLGAEFLNEKGKRQTMVMGCYGIGVSRIVAAAIEQSHDTKGMIWPWALAPYQIGLVCVDVKDKMLVDLSEKMYHELEVNGYEVLFDDRSERAGVKFNDMELIGLPIQINIGKKYVDTKKLEIKVRKTGEVFEKSVDEVVAFLGGISKKL